MKSIVCVDLDGVLNQFDGWKGADYFHPPRPGAREFLQRLNESGYEVIVFTVRWKPHVEQWLSDNGLAEFVSVVTDRKPPAHVYVDDRAVCFDGDFAAALEQISDFRAHWEK
jgi:NLI interacting factor-like phosphatase